MRQPTRAEGAVRSVERQLMLVLATDTHFGVKPDMRNGLFLTNDAIAPLLAVYDPDLTPAPERIHRLQLIFKWTQVIEIAAIEPWPAFRISWRFKRIVDHRVFAPVRGWFVANPSETERNWDTILEALFERVVSLGVRVELQRGWLDADYVEWVDDPAWPIDGAEGQGSYRTSARERVLAQRERPSPGEFIISWFAAGTRQPWQYTPREIVVTRECVHARLAGGRMAKLPLGALRRRVGGASNALIYIFGRCTPLVLAHRPNCPVRRLFDERLGLV